MSKLIILSEINNLDYLKKHGIYPSHFYTDIDMFENMSPFFMDAKVCCILAGTCSFSRRRLGELFDYLTKRIEDVDSNSIKELYILTDTVLEDVVFYKYTNTIRDVVKMQGKRVLKQKFKFWKTLDYSPSSKTVTFLSKLDSEDVASAVADYLDYVASRKTDLEEVIKKPKLV